MDDEEFLCPDCGEVLREDVVEKEVCEVQVEDGELMQGKWRDTYDVLIKVFCPDCGREWSEEEFLAEFLRKGE